MFSIRLEAQLATGKLTAEYYWPQHIADVRCLCKWKTETLENLRDRDSPISYGVLKPDEQGFYSRVAKFENFRGMFIHALDCDPISESMFEEFKRSQAIEGDILIAIGGYVGRPAIVQPIDPMFRLNINRHLARFRPNRKKIDPHYVLVYLSSPIGERQLRRQITGSVQAGINLEDLRLVPVPIVDVSVQRYLGDKARTSQKLCEKATQITEFATSKLEAEIGNTLEEWLEKAGTKRLMSATSYSTRVAANEIRGRLDPSGYHPELRGISKLAANTSTLFSRLTDVATIETDSRTRTQECNKIDRYVSILHVDNQGFVDVLAANTHQPESEGRVCEIGDVLLSGINPAANRIGVWPEISGRTACSPEFSILKPKKGVSPEYLAFALRSLPCLRQLIHLGQGTSSSRRRISESELANLWVPVPSDNVAIGNHLSVGQACLYFAKCLAIVAKQLTEELINGRMDAFHVVEAQELLNRGDTSGDREILSRMYVGGIDAVDTQPLFPNLDKYYETLKINESQVSARGDE